MTALIYSIFKWFSDELQALWWWSKQQALDFAVWIIESVPVPDFLLNMGDGGSIPDSVAFFLHPFEIGFGLSVFVAATVSRMLIKLIPGI
jgi:hypothetical protein